MSIAEARMDTGSGTQTPTASGSGGQGSWRGGGGGPGGRSGRRGGGGGRNSQGGRGGRSHGPDDKRSSDPRSRSDPITASSAVGEHGHPKGGSGGGKSAKRAAGRNNPLAGTKPRTNAVEHLRAFLARRWNPQAAMLDLSRMATDTFLMEREIFPPGHKQTKPAMARVIWKLVSELQPPVLTISYEHNNLSNLDSLEALDGFVPSVRNLSIAHNPLKEMVSLKAITSLKTGLGNLRELVTVGTPVRESEISKRGLEGYRTLLSSYFPYLSMLDGEPIFGLRFDLEADAIPAGPALPTATKTANNNEKLDFRPIPAFPTATVQNAIVGDETFVNAFLAKFFPLFDTARSELAVLYTPTSTFSLTITTSPPPRARHFKLGEVTAQQKTLSWKDWNSLSHNLLRSQRVEEKMQKLFVGPDAIGRAFTGGTESNKGLLKTRHPTASAERWAVDSVVLPTAAGALMLVNVHGEFEELPSLGLRSFSRSFIISPAPADSAALAAGWPLQIISDQLSIRSYAGHAAFAPDAVPVADHGLASAPGLGGVGLAPGLPVPPVLTDAQKEALVQQLAERSGLIVPFTIQCLEGNGWDLDRAWANFLELKAQIPKDAFIQ